MDFFGDFFLPTQTIGYPFGRGYYNRPRTYRLADLPDLFDEEDFYVPQPMKTRALRVPQVHCKEQKNGWIASVPLPGVRSFEDISLDLDEEVLHIHAVLYRRYQRQVYTHSLALPEGADPNEIRANFKNETLVIYIPRSRLPEKEEKLQIKPIPKKKEAEQPSERKEAPTEEKARSDIQEKPMESPKQQQVTRRSPLLFSMPKVSQSQTETHQVMSIQFPEGWDVKDNLDVEVCNGMLNISMVKKDNGTSFCFKRSVSLPAGVTEDKVTAKFANNTLEVTYPKPTPPKVYKIPLLSSTSEPSLSSIEGTETTTTTLESSSTTEQPQGSSSASEANTNESVSEEMKEKEVAVETA